jgi:hypothetical protein
VDISNEGDRRHHTDPNLRKVALTILAKAMADESRKTIEQPLPRSFAAILRKLKKVMDPSTGPACVP